MEKMARKIMGREKKPESPHDEYMRLALEVEEIAIMNGMTFSEINSFEHGSGIFKLGDTDDYYLAYSKIVQMKKLWDSLSAAEKVYHSGSDKEFFEGKWK